MRVAIYHNILWSKYKGVVFSQVHQNSGVVGVDPSFIQIAETEDIRLGLGSVDLSYHQYPFRLLFRGAYHKAPLFRRMGALMADLWRNPCDLVVMPGYHRAEYWAMLAVCIMLRRKRAVFCDSTSDDKPRVAWRDFAKRGFFSLCNGVFCYGIRAKQYIMSYGVSESKIFYRVQAAALPKDYDVNDVIRHSASYLRPEDAPHFLYVGRISPEKGLSDLFEAFKRLLVKKPRAHLDLVGHGPLVEELKQQVRDLHLENSVTFAGSKAMEDISKLLLDSTALVLPSHSEPWGLVVNESLSYGCPVVVSSACGCEPDLVHDGRTGYAFPMGDVNALEHALESVCDFDRRREQVARDCLSVISAYTPERAAAQILDGCLRLVGNS